MKVVIAGGRNYQLTPQDYVRLEEVRGMITEVIHGCGSSGVDYAINAWAEGHGIPMKKFPADRATHGRAAGPIRNRQMAEYAEAVIVFPGGSGTASMLRSGKALNRLIMDWSQHAGN